MSTTPGMAALISYLFPYCTSQICPDRWSIYHRWRRDHPYRKFHRVPPEPGGPFQASSFQLVKQTDQKIFCQQPPAIFQLARSVEARERAPSNQPYSVGRINNVSNVDVMRPPITTVASGLCTSAPAEVAIAIGMNPRLATSAVINTGRNRTRVPSLKASSVDIPCSLNRFI